MKQTFIGLYTKLQRPVPLSLISVIQAMCSSQFWYEAHQVASDHYSFVSHANVIPTR